MPHKWPLRSDSNERPADDPPGAPLTSANNRSRNIERLTLKRYEHHDAINLRPSCSAKLAKSLVFRVARGRAYARQQAAIHESFVGGGLPCAWHRHRPDPTFAKPSRRSRG